MIFFRRFIFVSAPVFAGLLLLLAQRPAGHAAGCVLRLSAGLRSQAPASADWAKTVTTLPVMEKALEILDPAGSSPDFKESRDRAGRLQRAAAVVPDAQTGDLEVTIRDENPAQAVRMANAICAAFQQVSAVSPVRMRLQHLERNLQALAEKISSLENEILPLRSRAALTPGSEDLQLSALTAELAQAQTQHQSLSGQYQEAQLEAAGEEERVQILRRAVRARPVKSGLTPAILIFSLIAAAAAGGIAGRYGLSRPH